MDKFDNTNLLVNFVFSEITIEHMQNNEGRAPFEDLTNIIKVIVYTHIHRRIHLYYLW